MEIIEAIELIKAGVANKVDDAIWADLGCGSGTFTKALAALLGDRSKIFAVDKKIQHFSAENEKAEIKFVRLDFSQDQLPFFNLDGILMANALHYVHDKIHFLTGLKKHLKPNGQMIIIEYDTEKQNQWVPYPISYKKLVDIFSSLGLTNIKKIGERDSIYRSGKMYACMINCQ
jgi:ubiquinone/menaquinone biosynthesis C-methylase UbiE